MNRAATLVVPALAAQALCLVLGCGGGGEADADGGQQGADLGPEELITPDDPGVADVRLEIDSTMDRRAISPFIYGSNQVDEDDTHGVTIGRIGGNRWTAYNWETNASNAGSDYLYQNDTYLGGGSLPGGAVANNVTPLHDDGLDALLTVPIAGWVAADTDGPTPNDGSGRDNGRFLPVLASGGDPGGAPRLNDGTVYTDEFVDWVRRTLMPNGTVFFSLDNEPDLWSSTHAEIHPTGVTYTELVERNVDHATAITRVVPDAVVFGPVNYGYAGFMNLQSASDAAGRDFIDFYLGAMSDAEDDAGRRLVDVLDVHWYPEARGANVRITEDDSSDPVADARMQAPRSLWDPSFTETSWITDCCSGGPIRLIPRLQEKIDVHYPGTGLAITEYNYGAAGHISGGVAQADVLGIFGREGLFAAMWWQLSEDRAFVDGAFEMFRDFDGDGGRFGDTSISASTSDVARVSVYASVDAASSGRMVVVAINRAGQPLSAGIRIAHTRRFRSARVFRLTAASSSPVPDTAATLTLTNALTVMLPARSVTTMELLP
ncbi:MAG: glycoside hydrolase family 44 protein [Polyangiales bacterium]